MARGKPFKKEEKIQMYESMINVVEGFNPDDKEDLIEFINEEIRVLKGEKKAPSYHVGINKLSESIYEILKNADEPLSIQDILSHESAKTFEIEEKGVKTTGITSPQRVSSILKKFIDEGKVERIAGKIITYKAK